MKQCKMLIKNELLKLGLFMTLLGLSKRNPKLKLL